jgi:hypothetical protein
VCPTSQADHQAFLTFCLSTKFVRNRERFLLRNYASSRHLLDDFNIHYVNDPVKCPSKLLCAGPVQHMSYSEHADSGYCTWCKLDAHAESQIHPAHQNPQSSITLYATR